MDIYNKYPWTNYHNANLYWVIETVKECEKKVKDFENEIGAIPETYETKQNITNNRKLSSSGNFTGKWNGKTFTEVFGKTQQNSDLIKYLTNQFSDGQTGLVIDGGFFEDTGIKKNYDGGRF